MGHLAIIFIIITNVFLVLILGVMAFAVYKLIKIQQLNSKSTDSTDSHYHPEIIGRMKELRESKQRKNSLFCPNHPDEPGEVTCGICDHYFCKSCAKSFKTLHFCKEHLPLIMNRDWVEVLTLKTSTHDPEEGVRLYETKKELFQQEELPTYIETHYKINVDHDYIETYLVMFSIKEDLEKVREFTNRLKS